MKNSIHLFVSVVLGFLVSGCMMTRDEIRDSASGRSTAQSQVSQAQIAKANQSARMDDLEEMVRSTQGRMEVVENELQQLKASEQEASGSTAASAEMNQKFLLFEQALNALEAQVRTLAAEIQSMKSSSATAPRAKRKGNFAGAEEAFNQKAWKKAIVGYQKYRDLNPKGKWYAEATYKIGVSFQELKMLSEAKAFYDEVIAKFPKASIANKAKYRLKNLK